MIHAWISFLLLLLFAQGAPEPTGPDQPLEGPGSPDYTHAAVKMSGLAEDENGYWLFEPDSPRPDSAPVVVFHHGYGAINPMIYGRWLRHIVQQGNIVIYPRYQKNLFSPNSKEFPHTASTAIRNALKELESGDHVRPVEEGLILAGHSYGGAISAYLGVNYEELGIPKPAGILLASPGTGPLNGARLERYEGMPEDVALLAMVSVNDHVVGQELGRIIFETAVNTPQRNLIIQHPDGYGDPALSAGHNESYALDADFDGGIHNLSYRRAIGVAKLNATDYYGYWKLLDALMDCVRSGENCEVAFGNTAPQRFMGRWSDGKLVRELEVVVPGD
ncbi:MAG: alpha/beta hydrolase fold domain-containing protein [Lewinellaceae bacterium]|nr:alpha/beta hydrolase fold domain-containing protein [Lewinellaceae bacterium]